MQVRMLAHAEDSQLRFAVILAHCGEELVL